MTTKVTDLRCPKCGKKLAEATIVTTGEIRIKCPRCRQIMAIKAG